MRVVMVRHGETDWNLHRKYLGHTDVPLNQKGYFETAEICENLLSDLAPLNGNILIASSDLQRCLYLAKRVQERLHVKTDIIVNKSFREIDFGDWEGLTFDEIQDKYPKQAALFLKQPNQLLFNGENLEQFSDRIVNGIQNIYNDVKDIHNINTLLIITHGGVIRVLKSLIHKGTPSDYWQYSANHGEVFCFEYPYVS
ncbi:hypothetical protein BHU72_08010 [Desulfuribacillus stibiiarsenatis]|uniref:Alpha-ribazole phosphatase n=1 Tax=Desulfuribacillus stibiiarsenatis TaxID=1390249 RepID=A0A1E5L3P1_9FIRM|nr:histidine phosphatase family protein [Desulfuribacillus stibiiarsenatis]OEH84768.1 hypothetical protein BHU72_08010 [Desulfuribacillus stibiiarsenatis]